VQFDLDVAEQLRGKSEVEPAADQHAAPQQQSARSPEIIIHAERSTAAIRATRRVQGKKSSRPKPGHGMSWGSHVSISRSKP
jgi:hypothetical protein